MADARNASLSTRKNREEEVQDELYHAQSRSVAAAEESADQLIHNIPLGSAGNASVALPDLQNHQFSRKIPALSHPFVWQNSRGRRPCKVQGTADPLRGALGAGAARRLALAAGRGTARDSSYSCLGARELQSISTQIIKMIVKTYS